MCDTSVLVPIPDLLWSKTTLSQAFAPEDPEFGTDDKGRQCLRLDACIVPAVQALWAAGIATESCCCGHGSAWGVITIQSREIPGLRGAEVLRRERYEELLSKERAFDSAVRHLAAAEQHQTGGE